MLNKQKYNYSYKLLDKYLLYYPLLTNFMIIIYLNNNGGLYNYNFSFLVTIICTVIFFLKYKRKKVNFITISGQTLSKKIGRIGIIIIGILFIFTFFILTNYGLGHKCTSFCFNSIIFSNFLDSAGLPAGIWLIGYGIFFNNTEINI